MSVHPFMFGLNLFIQGEMRRLILRDSRRRRGRPHIDFVGMSRSDFVASNNKKNYSIVGSDMFGADLNRVKCEDVKWKLRGILRKMFSELLETHKRRIRIRLFFKVNYIPQIEMTFFQLRMYRCK